MLVFLFGYPGVGKNYVGEILRNDFNFFFYDGDSDLGSEIETAIREGKLFSDQQRDEFFHRLITSTKKASCEHQNVVVSQTLAKNKSQKAMSEKFPDAVFIRIVVPMEIIRKRLKNRKDHLVPLEYAEKVFKYFEEPEIQHEVLHNDGDKEKIRTQLNKILNSTSPVKRER
ncbi:MAG: AAA family ATPase [Patescibacteria group bacterium]